MPMPSARKGACTPVIPPKSLSPKKRSWKKVPIGRLAPPAKPIRAVEAARIATPTLPPDRNRSPNSPSVERKLNGAATLAVSKRSRHQPPASVPTAMATDMSATIPTAEFISTPRESM